MLAVSTPSVLSTVSGCYLTGMQIKKLRLVALLWVNVIFRLYGRKLSLKFSYFCKDGNLNTYLLFSVRMDGNYVL